MSVERILGELKLDEKPRLIVFNKIDKLGEEQRRELELHHPGAIAISAKREETTHPLLEAMKHALWKEDKLIDSEPAQITSSEESP
jgi:GTP-binding protein HflX